MKLLSVLELPEQVESLFRAAFDFKRAGDGPLADQLAAHRVDVLLCSPAGPMIDQAFLAALPPSVKAIATYSVGYNHVDVAACKAAGIAVFNTPEVLAHSVADLAMLLILGAARRATESIALIREGRWIGWKPTQLLGVELRGKTLGIMGMGGIGRRIATRAAAFGMEVQYTNRRRLADEEGARFVANPVDLLASSDIFVLSCPSTPGTRHFIDAGRLARARPSLMVVNVGRGDLVCDDALITALKEGRIAAAGLDVFEGEPRFDRRYLDLPNVFMLPHIGSSTIEARMGMGQALINAVREWTGGGEPANRIA